MICQVDLYLHLPPVDMDGQPVVCAEGDGQQGDRGEAEDGGEGECDGAAEAHLDGQTGFSGPLTQKPSHSLSLSAHPSKVGH